MRTIMTRLSWLLALLLLPSMACHKDDTNSSDQSPDRPAAEQPTGGADDQPGAEATNSPARVPEEHAQMAHEATGSATTVEVSPEGTRFDPPVPADQIPAEAWYCNMGTVHYASMSQGDGSCPVCGMTLVQQATPGE